MLRFGVLGPLIAADDRGPVDLKGPRHRAVLARLLVARGRVVPVAMLIDDVWGGAAPAGAIGALQTFVSALRRALEPERPPRSPARVLVTSGPGYALRTAPDAVDAWRFEEALLASRDFPVAGAAPRHESPPSGAVRRDPPTGGAAASRDLPAASRDLPAAGWDVPAGGPAVAGDRPGGGAAATGDRAAVGRDVPAGGVAASFELPGGGGAAGRLGLPAGDAAVRPGGSAAAVLARLDEALGAWRGPAYGEFAEHPWARAEAARLDELRLLAVERRAEALLALGRAAEVAPDLEGVVGAHPGREGAWRLFALALYRAGRQSDALAALRRARRGLAESAGLDPGPELRALESAILSQSPSLLLPTPPTPTPPPPNPVPAPPAPPSAAPAPESAAPAPESAAPAPESAAPAPESAAPATDAPESAASATEAPASAAPATAVPASKASASAAPAAPATAAPATAAPATEASASAATAAPATAAPALKASASAVPASEASAPASAPPPPNPVPAPPAPTSAAPTSAAPTSAAPTSAASATEAAASTASTASTASAVPAFAVPASVWPASGASASDASASAAPGLAAAVPGAAAAAVAARGGVGAGWDVGLVGRSAESAQLLAAADGVRARGVLRLALVSGEAGAGKTALATAVADRLAADGWRTAWGTNPDDPGVPAGWPWDQILTTLADTIPAPPRTVNGDPAVARFRWQRAVGEHLAALARQAPLLLIVDDLHWAGAETLELLTALVTEPLAAPVLVVGTYRSTDLPPPLAETLGRVARAEPVRVYLGGLPAAEVPALVRATTGHDVTADVAATIHRRTGGNPFFVRELARLVAADGDLTDVPPGVRDVVRHRVAALPEATQRVLRQAAVLGPDLDVDLQTALTGDHPLVLDAVDLATARGFLVERGPRRFPFAHALVRDALASDVSVARRASWHAAAAAALERLRPDDVEALAHHYVSADDPATADQAYRYARAAAERAEARWAPSEAARRWAAALTVFRGDDRTRLELLMGRVRALAVTGDLARARDRRAEAVALAESIGEPILTARVIGAFDVPAIWTDPDDPALAQHLAGVAERTLAALPADRTADRSRLLATIALELRSAGGARAADAAREAEALARELDDPGVLAFALNARFMHSFGRAGLAPERARIGAELVALAERAELRTFEILGHLIQLQASSALADFAAAEAHADATDRLGEAYQSPLAGVFTAWYRAMRASIGGDEAGAETRYRAAGAHLAGTGMAGLDRGVLPFALFCQALRTGADLGVFADADFGVFEPWVRPHVVGDDDGPEPGSPAARRIAAAIPESPRDLLYEVRTCLHALTAIAARDRELMERLYTALLPARDELAGAGSGLLTLDPVARYLSNLASALRRPDVARMHHDEARRVLDRAHRTGPSTSRRAHAPDRDPDDPS